MGSCGERCSPPIARGGHRAHRPPRARPALRPRHTPDQRGVVRSTSSAVNSRCAESAMARSPNSAYVLRHPAPSDDQAGEPRGVEAARAGRRPRPALRTGLGVDDVARHGQVRVHRLARDQQVHDLRGALEDPVDPQVAQHLLGRDAPLPARRASPRSRTRARRGSAPGRRPRAGPSRRRGAWPGRPRCGCRGCPRRRVRRTGRAPPPARTRWPRRTRSSRPRPRARRRAGPAGRGPPTTRGRSSDRRPPRRCGWPYRRVAPCG